MQRLTTASFWCTHRPSREGKASTAVASTGVRSSSWSETRCATAAERFPYLFPKPGANRTKLKWRMWTVSRAECRHSWWRLYRRSGRRVSCHVVEAGGGRGSILLITLAATWLVNRDIAGHWPAEIAMERLPEVN